MYLQFFRKKVGRFHGFTLVELIVVISILAILGTIAFMSIGGYASSSRDAKRISNVSLLSKGFDVVISQGGPINTTKTATGFNISISGSTLVMTGYYGTTNETLTQSIKIISNDINTYDGYQEYRYSYFPKQQKYQILATLESSTNAKVTFSIPIIDRVFATTLGDVGYPYVRGNFVATGGISNIIVDGATWTTKTPVSGIKTFSTVETIKTTAAIPLVGAGVIPMDGVCGNPAATPTPPVTGLCSVGILTGSIVDQGVNLNFTWTCDGVNGGTPTAINACSTLHSPVNCIFDASNFDQCSFAP